MVLGVRTIGDFSPKRRWQEFKFLSLPAIPVPTNAL
jgi:hypothetical protein